jgi:hypothetical protein
LQEEHTMTGNANNRISRMLSRAGLGARVLAAVAVAGVISAACDVHGVAAPGTLSSIIVTPNATMAAASTQQMLAVGFDADGRVVTITPAWTVGAGGGTINAGGIFSAGAVTGLFANTVVATVGSISGRASITVTPGVLATITVVPNPVTLGAAGTQQFIAVGKDAGGNLVQFTPTWSVVAGGGAITPAGIFTAGALPGTYTNTVQAGNQGITAFATVIVTVGPVTTLTVTPNPAALIVGARQQFVATGKDAGGNTVVVATTWSIAAGGGTVDGGGMFTAGMTPGTFTNSVTATSGTLSGTATVTVTGGPLASITITPNPAIMSISGTQQFTAVGKDAAGNVVVFTPTWAVVTTANGASITQAGLYTAGTVTGTFINKVRASSGSIAGFATITVTSGPLAAITVTPNPVFMPTNALQQFLAIGRDSSGNVFALKPVWSVVNGGGVIDTVGNFTSGNTVGVFTNTIKATLGTISGFATVNTNIASGLLATITVTPNPSNLAIGGTQTFSAVGKDASGNILAIVPVWSVVNATAGSINSGTGLFTAGVVSGTYVNSVQATVGAVSGFATVIVATTVTPLVNFGAAAINGIMAGASVTCTGTGVIQASTGTANIAISPGSTMSGFPPCVFSGTTNLGDATALADQNILTAVYNTLAGLPCPAANNFGTVDYASKTLPVGVYCSASTMNVTGTLTLDGGGDPNATFVFQAGSALIGAANIVLINSAQAKNVYWQVGSSATLNASAWQGNIVAFTSISLNVNSTLLGRALARNGSVTMDAAHNVITLP